MEATITQSFHTQTQTPIEAIFDNVTDALLSVGDDGTIRNCNKVCTRYFGRPRRELLGAQLHTVLPDASGFSVADYLAPFMSSLDATSLDLPSGEVIAQRADRETFHAEINASLLENVSGDVYIISLRVASDRIRAEIALRENE